MSFPVVSISFLLFLILILGLPVVLQIWLSKREGKIPGLILPILNLLFSILVTVGRIVYEVDLGAADVVSFFLTLAMLNIPTVIYLCIYFACRERFSQKPQIDKMNLQDL